MRSERSKVNSEKSLIISELNDEKSLIICEFDEDMENLNDQVIETDEIVEAAGAYEEMVKHWEGKAYHLKQTISGLNKKMRQMEDKIKEKDMVIKANDEVVVAAGVYEETVKHWEGKAYHLKQTISGLNKKMRNMENEIKEKDWVFKVNLELFEQEIETLKSQTFAKDQIILNLNEKQSKVNDELQQKGRILGIYEDSSKYFKGKVGQLEEEIRDLKGDKSTAYQMIDRNNSEQSKANGKLIVSELNDEKSLILTELNGDIGKLDFQVIEIDEAVEVAGAYEEMVKHWESKVYHLKQTISGLSKKMRQMENEIKEKDCVYKAKLEQFEQELDVLKGQIFAKDQIILNLDGKQSKINDVLQEKDRTLGIYTDSSKYFKGKVGQLEGEIQDLRGEKSTAYKMIDEIKFEHSKAIDGKDLIINELNEEIGKLKNEVHEKDQVVGKYKDEVKFFKGKVRQLEREIKDLKGRADKMVVEMKCNQLAAQETIEEMNCEKLKYHDEKDKIASELHEEICKLRNQIHKKDQVVVMYKEKVKCFEEQQAVKEIRGLSDQKQAANEMIEILKRQQLAAGHMIKRINSEQQASYQTIEKKKGEQLAAGQIADNMVSELSKANGEETRRIDELYEEIGKLKNLLLEKAELVGMYEEKLKSIDAKVVQVERGNNDFCQKLSGDQMIEKVKSAQPKANHAVEELTFRNLESYMIIDSDPRIVLRTMPKVPTACNNSTKRTWIGLQRTDSPPAGSSGDSPQAEISDVDREKECKRLKVNSGGVDKNDKQNSVRSSTDSRENMDDKVYISEISPPSTQMVSPFSQRIVSIPQSDSPNEDKSNSDDDDESCSESAINNILASVRCQRFCIRLPSLAEMQKEFDDNIEFCMNAVCVLYRHNISNPGKLGQFNAMRGSELAEYLINGDAQYRLRKLEFEVKPDDLVLCRRLAKEYSVKLFMIYNNGEDPLFKWK